MTLLEESLLHLVYELQQYAEANKGEEDGYLAKQIYHFAKFIKSCHDPRMVHTTLGQLQIVEILEKDGRIKPRFGYKQGKKYTRKKVTPKVMKEIQDGLWNDPLTFAFELRHRRENQPQKAQRLLDRHDLLSESAFSNATNVEIPDGKVDKVDDGQRESTTQAAADYYNKK